MAKRLPLNKPNRKLGSTASSRRISLSVKTPRLNRGERFIQESRQLYAAANEIIQAEIGHSQQKSVSVPRMAQVLEMRLNRRGFDCNVYPGRRDGIAILLFEYGDVTYLATPLDLTIPLP